VTRSTETNTAATLRPVTSPEDQAALDKLRSQVVDLESMVTPAVLEGLQKEHGIRDALGATDAAALKTYRKALADTIERGAR
jgi:hypothetical protein